jgi:hypothetical protein
MPRKNPNAAANNTVRAGPIAFFFILAHSSLAHPLTHSLTHWLTLRRSVWCEVGEELAVIGCDGEED